MIFFLYVRINIFEPLHVKEAWLMLKWHWKRRLANEAWNHRPPFWISIIIVIIRVNADCLSSSQSNGSLVIPAENRSNHMNDLVITINCSLLGVGDKDGRQTSFTQSATSNPPCWVLKARNQKHRGKPLLFHDKCPGLFYVHYTTHGTALRSWRPARLGFEPTFWQHQNFSPMH